MADRRELLRRFLAEPALVTASQIVEARAQYGATTFGMTDAEILAGLHRWSDARASLSAAQLLGIKED